MSRIRQYIQLNCRFAVISTFRIGDNNNNNNQNELKQKIRLLDIGFIEMKGGYFDDECKIIEVKSCFIPEINNETAIKLGFEFEQRSILFKDENGFVEIGTNENVGMGKILNGFDNVTVSDNFVYTVKIIKNYYLQLLKCCNRKIFLKEIEPTGFNRVAYNSHYPLQELDLDDVK